MKNIFILLFLTYAIPIFCFQQDSLNQDFSHRIKLIEDHQANIDGAINNRFTELKQNINKELFLPKWFSYIGIPLSLFGVLGIIWQGGKFVNKKIRENIEKIVIENKRAIKEAVEKQHTEMLLVKSKRILVLTKEEKDITFLKNFFKKMKFPKDNIRFEATNSILPNSRAAYVESFDMIFANNEHTDLDFDIIQSYFKNSKPTAVLFYFGNKRFDPPNDQIKNRLSFANARTQIYGNLINLFKYQELL